MSTEFEQCATGQRARYTFRLEGVPAASVSLVGCFNGWSTTRHLMRRVDGNWETTLLLPPGKYSYCFFAIDHGDLPRGTILKMGSTIDVGLPDEPPLPQRSDEFLIESA